MVTHQGSVYSQCCFNFTDHTVKPHNDTQTTAFQASILLQHKLKQEAQLMLTNPRDAFLSQMVPFGFEKCCNLETGIRGHSSYHSVALIWFLLVSYMSVLTLSLRRTIFLDICLQKLQWPWNQGLGSPKVIENGTICQIVYDLLLMFYSNKRLYLVSSRRDNIVKTQFSHTPPPIQCTVT